MAGPRICLVIDYQNIHLSARDTFAPAGTPAEQVLIDPLKFAQQVVRLREARQRDLSQTGATLDSVQVFRGQMSNQHHPTLYRASQKQRSEWTRDPRVRVEYRTLRYPPGYPNSSKPPREKGIDVLVALNLVKAALSGQYDVVILASHDTDLEPALEMAVADGAAKIETAGWDKCRVLRPSGRRLWHTALSGADMVQTRDRRIYLPQPPGP